LNWDDEKSLWLSSATITAVVMKPEPVRRIIEEWCQVFLFDVWWDASAQEIMIKALSPEPSGETPATLTEDYEILEDSLSIKRDAKSRFTQIRAWHSRVDASKSNDPENFSKLQIALDAIRSGADLYNSSSIKTIISRWFDSEARAAQLTGRMLARFSDTPEVINFAIHAKDSSSVSLAKRVTVQSWQMQDFTGATESRTYQVTKIANDTRDKNKIMVTAITSSFSGRYAFIAPAGLPDYSSATEEQKKKYAFICQASGFFSDGEPAYKII
jgi:hypothetical protein